MNKFAAAVVGPDETPVSPEQRLASHQDGGPALANFVSDTFGLGPNIYTPSGARTLNGNSAAPLRIPRNLTTGTFNLVVKDRFAFPPERRVFSPGELTKVNPTVPETF